MGSRLGSHAAGARTQFHPRHVTNSALVIDPRDISSLFQNVAGSTAVTAGGQTVGYATDRSSNAFDLTAAADDTTRPTYETTDAPHINFDGTNDILRRTADLGMFSGGACTVSVAIKANPGTSDYLVAEGNSGNVCDIYGTVRSDGTTSTSAKEFIRNNSCTIDSDANMLEVNVFDNTNRIYTVIDTGSTLAAFLDGVAGDTGAYTRTGSTTINRFGLGGLQRSTASAWMASRLYGLVIVNRAVNANERIHIEAWNRYRLP